MRCRDQPQDREFTVDCAVRRALAPAVPGVVLGALRGDAVQPTVTEVRSEVLESVACSIPGSGRGYSRGTVVAEACGNRTHQAASKAACLVLKTKTPPLMGAPKRHWPPATRLLWRYISTFSNCAARPDVQRCIQVVGTTGQKRVTTMDELSAQHKQDD